MHSSSSFTQQSGRLFHFIRFDFILSIKSHMSDAMWIDVSTVHCQLENIDMARLVPAPTMTSGDAVTSCLCLFWFSARPPAALVTHTHGHAHTTDYDYLRVEMLANNELSIIWRSTAFNGRLRVTLFLARTPVPVGRMCASHVSTLCSVQYSGGIIRNANVFN